MPRNASKVLHFRSSCGYYGAEAVIDQLAAARPERTLVVTLLDARGPHRELADRVRARGGLVEELPSSGAFDLRLVPRLAEVARRFGVDVIHSHDYKTDVVAALVAPLVGAKHVATMHGFLGGEARLGLYERLDLVALRGADAIVVVSERLRELLESRGHSGRIARIANGVDVERFKPTADHFSARALLNLPADAFVVGAVGRLSAEKNHAALLRTFHVVRSIKPDAILAIVGDGPLRSHLASLAATLGLTEHVRFLGHVASMEEVYPAFDVVALPSLTEGLPITILEAAACARPIVASDVGDVSRVIVPDETGLLVPPADDDALASALARLVSSPRGRARLGSAARERIVESFSSQACAAAYDRVYDGLGRSPALRPSRFAAEVRP